MAQVLTSETFDRMLREALEKHVAAETDKAVEAAKATLETTLRGALAHVALTLLKHYRIDMQHGEIVITVKNEAKL